MKGYTDRRRVLDLVWDVLKPGGVVFMDGYWVNSAFEDFCTEKQVPAVKAGKVAALCKNITDSQGV